MTNFIQESTDDFEDDEMINDKFSGTEYEQDKKMIVESTKDKLDSDINALVKDIKSRKKQNDKMVNDNVHKGDLFGESIAAKAEEFLEMKKAFIKKMRSKE